MVTKEEFDEILHRIKLHSSDVASMMLKENDKKLLLFYSLGFLADMYGDSADELLAKGEDYGATFYAGKATQIHQFAFDVFGMAPQKEYYKKTPFKALNVKTNSPVAEIQQLAQFAAANVHPDQEIIQDEDLLIPAIKKMFKDHNKFGIEFKYVEVLRKTFHKLINKPPKLEMVYELLLVLENVDMIRKMAEEHKQQEIAEETKENKLKRANLEHLDTMKGIQKSKREKRYGK